MCHQQRKNCAPKIHSQAAELRMPRWPPDCLPASFQRERKPASNLSALPPMADPAPELLHSTLSLAPSGVPPLHRRDISRTVCPAVLYSWGPVAEGALDRQHQFTKPFPVCLNCARARLSGGVQSPNPKCTALAASQLNRSLVIHVHCDQTLQTNWCREVIMVLYVASFTTCKPGSIIKAIGDIYEDQTHNSVNNMTTGDTPNICPPPLFPSSLRLSGTT